MKVIVTSDIHGSSERLEYILDNYKADYFIDCGDSELPEYKLLSVLTVKGNCDFRSYPLTRILKVNDDIKIFIHHGHRYKVNQMVALAKQEGCKIVCYGHTHIKKIEEIDEVYVLNPGSVSRPRKGNPKTFALINIDDKTKDVSFEFIKITL